MAQCTAKSKRTGLQCRQSAMHGKDKCYHHGGATPIIHGLRSKYKGARLGDRVQELIEDPDLTNMKVQLAVLVAHQQRFLEMFEQTGTWGLGGFTAFQGVTAEIIKGIDRYLKQTEGTKHTIRIEQIQVVVNQIVKVADETIRDPVDRKRFAERIGVLSLPADTSPN